MNTIWLTFGSILGFFGGFALGLYALKHVTKGHTVQKLIEDRKAKLWLGLFAWFFAFCGAFIGYKLAGFYLVEASLI